ncbi:MAG: UDP-N-acetyl-D-galactosamine dehydrogenase [Limisphaerales bacterium]|jgi:UDP-N-acetyl-D-galactosamine dehydrogenase
MYRELVDKKKTLAVIGLGYVGLPIALAFARKVKVIGFDISEERVELMKNGKDPSDELDSSEFEGCDIEFTHDPEQLKDAHFFVVAVPTPVDEHRVPNLKPIQMASATIGNVLKQGDYVVYESTVFPGCTEQICQPILEELSGLKLGEGFKLGYSPERINPGDKVHTLTNVVKVSSGSDPEAAEEIAQTYELVVSAGVHRAPSIKVAEAAKIIENTQRDLNIALMNELSKIFDKMDINTHDVIEAAGTKWNFLKFTPGLVGGHCIGVDPYYLTYKAMQLGYTPQIILSGRRVNDGMSAYVARKTVMMVLESGRSIQNGKILVLGATFKENVTDIRNSKVAELVSTLKTYHCEVDVADPYASSDQVKKEYGFELVEKFGSNYDAVVLCVNHNEYMNKPESWFEDMSAGRGIFVDVKGVYKDKINNMKYWSL